MKKQNKSSLQFSENPKLNDEKLVITPFTEGSKFNIWPQFTFQQNQVHVASKIQGNHSQQQVYPDEQTEIKFNNR